jgi:hypothetical protein
VPYAAGRLSFGKMTDIGDGQGVGMQIDHVVFSSQELRGHARRFTKTIKKVWFYFSAPFKNNCPGRTSKGCGK